MSDADLEAVQRRWELPTRVTQAMQVAVQKQVIVRALAKAAKAAQREGGETEGEGGGEGAAVQAPPPPLPLRLMQWFPALQWLPARMIGIGVQPEHIRCPAAS